MNQRIILPTPPLTFTHPVTKKTEKRTFLKRETQLFFHDYYYAGDKEEREKIGSVANIVTTLKNQFGNADPQRLKVAQSQLEEILITDLACISEKVSQNLIPYTICVVPRSKTLQTYYSTQLLFVESVKNTIKKMSTLLCFDGTDFIIRHTNTRTTHMERAGYGGDGEMPYPGITQDTCHISTGVKDKNILLIDDLYTAGVNIDEDVIQTLLNHGAKEVILYTLGRTTRK